MALPRQQTFSALIEWNYELVSLTYTLVADKNNLIAETNESNNTVSATAFGYF